MPIAVAGSNKPRIPTVEFIVNLKTDVAASPKFPCKIWFGTEMVESIFNKALFIPLLISTGRKL